MMRDPQRAGAQWGTRHREMLDQVFPLWYGPRAVELDNLDDDSFYGWSVLSLGVRFAYPILLESRTVYAHLFEEDAVWAVLRAMSWDDRPAQRAIWTQGQSAPLNVPVRFVRLPLTQLHSWLKVFKDLPIIADQSLVKDSALPMRRLRIEWEYTSCVIEKVWRGAAPEHAALLQAWTHVWQEMGEALRVAPQIAPHEVTELFDAVQPDTSVYQPQEYTPDWLALP